jgi:hypothetical protein
MIGRCEIRTIFFFLLAALLSSCATLFNQPLQKISVSSDEKIKINSVDKVLMSDSSPAYNNGPKRYYVQRSNRPLYINLQIDSVKKTIILKAKNSFAYWYNIPSNYGIGMLVDKDNLKRFGYSKYNYLAVKDTAIKIYRFAPAKKGSINLALSLPILNGFCLTDSSNGKYNSAGIWGLEAGLEYFYTSNAYLSLNIGAATDVFGEHIGTGYFETGSTLFASARNNNVIGSFDLGYGLNLSKLIWKKTFSDSAVSTEQSKKSIGLGVSLAAQCRIGNYFRLGLLYQPCIINTSFKPVVNYQHYLSLNLIWKLRVK